MSEPIIRIVLVDDHEMVRQSIKALLTREPGFDVVAVGATGHDAIRLARQTEPDVVILDVSMPELDGIRAAGVIRDQGLSAAVVMLSMHKDRTLIQQARRRGALGYVAKQNAARDLIPTIRAAVADRIAG